MDHWTLYTAPGTCALATHIALHEAGAAFDVVTIDFAADQQQSPAYLTTNPKGRVPALATPEGVLTETPALLLFVAQRFPEARLERLLGPRLRHVALTGRSSTGGHEIHRPHRSGNDRRGPRLLPED